MSRRSRLLKSVRSESRAFRRNRLIRQMQRGDELAIVETFGRRAAYAMTQEKRQAEANRKRREALHAQ